MCSIVVRKGDYSIVNMVASDQCWDCEVMGLRVH